MKRALLVIDVQNAYFTGKMPVTYPAGSFSNILKVIDTANFNQIPVILIQHANSGFMQRNTPDWEIHPEVLQKPYTALVEKTLPGSFTGTNLEELLRLAQADTVVISGYMTQMCCDTTARQACHLGYQVEFLADATGTLDIANYAGKIKASDLHQAILITQAMRFSRVMTTEEWIAHQSTN